MAYKVSLVNYSLKLRRLLLSSIVLITILSSCNSLNEKNNEKPLSVIAKTVEFYDDGKPKINELFTKVNGELVIYGYEELYNSGKLKITGKYNLAKHREGLWESFYEDGSSWSIGSFTNGIESGEKRVWYPNGKLRYKGEMKGDKPVGSWEFWDEKGRKTIKKYQ